MKYPMQPIVFDPSGVARFKRNQIVHWLLAKSGMTLEDLASMRFSNEDQAQLIQLLGYSVQEFGEQKFVTDEAYEHAQHALELIVNNERMY